MKTKEVKKFVDWLVKQAIKNTDNGTWMFYWDDFDDPEKVKLEAFLIMVLLERREEVAEANISEDGIEVVLYDGYWE